MNHAWGNRKLHRGSSLLRTLVVAAASLTTLMVCFAIYQSSQKPRTDVTSATRAEVLALPGRGEGTAPREAGGAVEIAPNVRIGSGEGTVLSIYPRHGEQAIAEVEADNWFPTREGGNELKLIKPLVRLRTKSGQRVNVRSVEGLIEINTTATQRGKRIEWQRGALTGEVVVEIDRLSQKEREALPPHEREVLAPWRLITIRLDRIEFDLEYNQVKIDGPFQLSSRELDLEATGLEARLDPAGGRVETLKITEGRSLTLRASPEALSIGGGVSTETQSISWLDAIRAGLSRGPAQADAPPASGAKTAASPPSDKAYLDAEGALVLPKGKGPSAQPDAVITYKARFEDKVTVVQQRAGVEVGKLEADALEILRDFGAADRASATATDPSRAAPTAPAEASPEDALSVRWRGPLVVEWVPPESGEAGASQAYRLWLQAYGEPLRVADETGQATAAELTFHRETGEIHMAGSNQRPLVLDNGRQGRIEAVHLSTTGDAAKRTVLFTGPGRLIESRDPAYGAEGAGTAPLLSQDQPGGSIRFAERMELELERVSSTRADVRNLRTITEEKLVPREARFFGAVVMEDAARRIASDTMKLGFQPSADRLRVKNLEAAGGVDALLGERPRSAVTCSRLEVDFDPAATHTTPVQARAIDRVEASHDSGRLSAAKSIVFDFQTRHEEVAGEADLLAAYLTARRDGVDPGTLDWNAQRLEARQRTRQVERVTLRRLTAEEDVTALDEPRGLDIRARRLECGLNDAQEIESAVVEGTPQVWAHARLDTLTVDGPRVAFSMSSKDASVPGAGRMTFLSGRDLDGSPIDPPIPVNVQWTQSMTFSGAENLAGFLGEVHASSEHHTFDAERVDITFQDKPADPVVAAPKRDWWILKDALRQLSSEPGRSADLPGSAALNKEPILLTATGRVTALMSNEDPASGRILNRAQLKGPQLSVDLKTGGSGLTISGEGTLLIEDYESHEKAPQASLNGFLALGSSSDRSQTLIQWDRVMRYSLDTDRAEFEGNVDLRHLTGPYLVRQAELGLSPPKEGDDGRDTRLGCDRLVVDFATDGMDSSSPSRGLDTRRIRQFRAVGNVSVNDPQIILSAADLIYHRTTQQLLIQGTKDASAELYVRKPGAAPFTWRHQEMSLNLETLEARVIVPRGMGALP